MLIIIYKFPCIEDRKWINYSKNIILNKLLKNKRKKKNHFLYWNCNFIIFWFCLNVIKMYQMLDFIILPIHVQSFYHSYWYKLFSMNFSYIIFLLFFIFIFISIFIWLKAVLIFVLHFNDYFLHTVYDLFINIYQISNQD